MLKSFKKQSTLAKSENQNQNIFVKAYIFESTNLSHLKLHKLVHKKSSLFFEWNVNHIHNSVRSKQSTVGGIQKQIIAGVCTLANSCSLHVFRLSCFVYSRSGNYCDCIIMCGVSDMIFNSRKLFRRYKKHTHRNCNKTILIKDPAQVAKWLIYKVVATTYAHWKLADAAVEMNSYLRARTVHGFWSNSEVFVSADAGLRKIKAYVEIWRPSSTKEE